MCSSSVWGEEAGLPDLLRIRRAPAVGLLVGGRDLGQPLLDRALAVEQQVLGHPDALVHRRLRVGQEQLDHLLVAGAAEDQWSEPFKKDS